MQYEPTISTYSSKTLPIEDTLLKQSTHLNKHSQINTEFHDDEFNKKFANAIQDSSNNTKNNTKITEPVYVKVPLIGHLSINTLINALRILMGLCVLFFVCLIGLYRFQLDNYRIKTRLFTDISLHSQYLAKASFGLIYTNQPFLEQFKNSYQTINTHLNTLLYAHTHLLIVDRTSLSAIAKVYNYYVKGVNFIVPPVSQEINQIISIWKPIDLQAPLLIKHALTGFKYNELNNLSSQTNLNIDKKDSLNKLLNIYVSNDEWPLFFNKESESMQVALQSAQKTLDQAFNRFQEVFWWGGISSAISAVLIGSLILLIQKTYYKKTIQSHLKENQKITLLLEDIKAKSYAEQTRTNEINQNNQTAILRLMNELQAIGQGNLTIQATVSEDIMGSLADAINLTVENLRSLVEKINQTTEGVANASNKTRQTTTLLLELNQHNSQHIQETGDRVLNMANDITEVCNRADGSATVAQKALSAAYTGQQAVQASLQGMNSIRDKIQDTSKRIKHLGESSQQIGEIVAMIGDITDQTNILALNAAIQAASAGESGHGFTVVAQEIQRLAERSGEATKQIYNLVRTIQTDTQDAILAMEKSTYEVVEGTKLADAAGIAITDIAKVSQELANIMLEISHTTRGQANQAKIVSAAIKHMLTLTEHTTVGTQDTFQSIDQLSMLTHTLKQSVTRFKVKI